MKLACYFISFYLADTCVWNAHFSDFIHAY